MLPSLLFALSLILSINQSINASITFLPRTLSAPWHARWDSNMEYINKPTNVVLTNGTSRTFPNVLMVQGDGDDGQNPTNDIWASPDKGQTWHLIAGIGRTGQAYREYAQYSFSPVLTRPATGIDNNGNVFRIGGLRNSDGIRPRDSVWMTTNGGVQWTNQGAAPNAVNFSPGRDRANIIVDSNNQLFIVGGQARNEGDVMTNTVWRSRDAGVTWEEMPHTPWQRPRGSALMLNHYSKPLGRDVLTYLTGFDGRGGNPSLYNEIWISDDSANTWKQVRTNWGSGLPPFLKRDAANGEITDKGILVLVGGQHVYPNNTYEALNDIWVSLDGGYQWGLCNEDAPFADRRDLFTAMDNNGFLYVAGGQDMTKGSRYNDVWRSSISFDNPLQVARECNVPMPACGPGIACLPGDSKTTFLSNGTVTCPAVRKCAGLPDFYLDFDVMTTKAPWTARYWMNVEYFSKTITVKTSATGTRQLVNPLIAHGGDVTTNDVWASVDSGKTWLNIAGSGSFSTTTSYWPARQFANSIVNQVTKHIIRVGGLSSSAESSVVNDVWVTSDAVTWFKQAATNLPPRQLPHLIVSDTGKLFLSGGVLANGSTAKDMWSSVDNGASWTLITETLPWNSARGRAKGMLLADRVPQLGNKDILFAGIGWDGTNMYNDIWVSSDEAVTWARVTARAPFAARDAAAYEITVDGVIIVSGGQTGPNQQNDAWVSADGGYTWGLCSAESFWSDRREPAGVIDNDGYFYIMGGRETADAGAPNFNDVFRTSMSLSNPVAVAAACNIKISPCGTGLICWPGAPGTVVTSTGVTCPALEECGPPRPKSSSSSTGRARSSSSSSTGRGVDCKKNPCHDSCPSVCDVELCGQPDPEWNPQCFEDVSSSSTGAAITTGSGLSMGVIVAIIAVIAVIVIGGGYWYYKRRNSTDPMSSASMTELGKASAQHQNSINTSLLSDEHPTSSSSGAPAAF